MAGNKVTFVIEGHSKRGVQAIDALTKSLDRLTGHKGVRLLERQFESARQEVNTLKAALRTVASDLARLRTTGGLTALTQGLRTARLEARSLAKSMGSVAMALQVMTGRSMKGLTSQAAQAAIAQQRVAQATAKTAQAQAQATAATHRAALAAQRLAQVQQRLPQQVRGWASGLSVVERTAGRILMAFGRIVSVSGKIAHSMSMGFSRIGIQGAGPLQSLGISTRMGGIALGNQLATLGQTGIQGVLKAIPGVMAIVTELGVRIGTALTGFIVKAAGLGAQALLTAVGGIVGAGIAGLLGPLGKLIGTGVGLTIHALGNILSALTNLAGEIVTQLGNIFTGIAEAARGAIQGVMGMASEMLSSLVSIAGEVVGKVAGILGTVGKMTLGTAAVIGGFAFKDVAQTSKGIAKVNVLLESELTADQKRGLQGWIRNLLREVRSMTPQIAFDTLERAVSTGFQGDIEGAKRLATAATKLAAVGQTPEAAPTAARIMAKTYGLFREELEAEGGDPFLVIADHIQALVNYGDLKLPEIVDRLGEILASGKAVGASFKDIMVLLAQMSQSLGVEQTFTDVRHLFTDPLKFGPQAKQLLSSRGIGLGQPTPEQAKRMVELRKQIAQEEGKAGAKTDAKAIQQQLAILLAKSNLLKKTGRKAEAEVLDVEIAKANVALKALQDGGTDAADRVAKLKKELADLEGQVTKTKNPLQLLSEIMQAGFTPSQAAVLFPNKRALVGYLVQLFQDPTLAKSIEDGIRNTASGSVERGLGRVQDSLPSRLERLWTAIKDPFVAIWTRLEGPLNAAIDSLSGNLERFGDWWRKVIADSGAVAFLDNLKQKFSSLVNIDLTHVFDFLDDPGSVAGFWESMNSGLNAAWKLGGQVVTVFTTLFEWITKVVGIDWSKVGAAIKPIVDWTGATVGQLAEGKTDNLDAMVASIKATWEEVWEGTKYLFKTYVWEPAMGFLDTLKETWNTVWDKAGQFVSDLTRWAITLGGILAGTALLPGGRPGGVGGGGPGGGGPMVVGGGRGNLVGGALVGLGGPALVDNQSAKNTLHWAGIGWALGGPWGGALGAGGGALSELHKANQDAQDAVGPDVKAYQAKSIEEIREEFEKLAKQTGPEALHALVRLNGALHLLMREPGGHFMETGFRRSAFEELQSRVGPEVRRRQAELALQIEMREREEAMKAAAEADRRYAQALALITEQMAARAANLALPGEFEKSLEALGLRAFSAPAPREFTDAEVMGMRLGIPQIPPALPPLPIDKTIGVPPGFNEPQTVEEAVKAAALPSSVKKRRQIPGYTYDEGMGVYRGGIRKVASPFGLPVGGTLGGTMYSPSSWAKKIARAEENPSFEGGRWERFTSRGKEEQKKRDEEAKSAKMSEAADALGSIDEKRLDAVEDRIAEAMKKLGLAVPKIIETQDKNAGELGDVVERGLDALADADGKHRDRITRLEELVNSIEAAANSAGDLGVGDGSNG